MKLSVLYSHLLAEAFISAAMLSLAIPSYAQVSATFPATDLSSLRSTLATADADVVHKLDGPLRFVLDQSKKNPSYSRSTFGLRFSSNQRYGEVFQELDGWPIVDLTHRGDLNASQAALGRISGVEVLATASTPSYDVISCRIRPDALLSVARIGDVRGLRAALSMINREGDEEGRAQGAVGNQAEAGLEVEAMRFATFGLIQGSGISIGTLSDSVDTFAGGISDSQTTGDLPPDNKLNILNDTANGSDEGRAMMEHIYDIAPLASSYGYATAFGGKASFAANITALGNAGMDIICDDVLYIDEAIYQDDVIAQAVSSYVDSGGIYFSVAGNRGTLAREFAWKDDDNDGIAEFSGTDERLTATIKFGSADRSIAVMWAEPYGNATNDLAINAYFNGNFIVGSTNNNIGADPFDSFQATGNGTIELEVTASTTPPDGLVFKVIIFDSGSFSSFDEYPENFQGIVVPHAGTPKSIAIGAAPFFDRDVAETFSSRGPFKHYFTPDGIRYLFGPKVFDKPDFLSIDGCNTSFFGSDAPEDADSFPNFFGTSAATPNAAAVGALVLQAAGGPGSLTRDEMHDILRYTTEDLGNDGFDTTNGHGRINAVGAVAAALGPEPNPISIYPSHRGLASLTGQSLSNVVDKDSFKISFDTDGDADFLITRGVGDADPMLLLFNSDGNVRGSVYDNSLGNVNGTLEATVGTGVYTLQAQAEDNFSGDTPYSITVLGPIVETLNSVDLDATGNSTLSNFSVSPTGDLDYFQTIAPEDVSGSLEVRVSSETVEPIIRLFSSNGFELFAEYSTTSGSPNVATATVASPAAGQEIIVMVTAEDYIGTGDYSLTIDYGTNGMPDSIKPLPGSVAWVVRPNPVTGSYQTLNPFLSPGEVNYTLWVPNSESVNVSSLGDVANALLSGIYDASGLLLSSDGPGMRRRFRPM